MMNIDQEFQDHLIPLSESEFSHLTEQICSEGCRDPLVIWKGKNILVDGHNRLKICSENEIEFKSIEKEFESRDDVLKWIDRNQIARRNLSPADFKIVSGRIYNRRKAKKHSEKVAGQVDPQDRTSVELAEELGVSEKTVRRNGERAEVHDKLLKAGEKDAAKKVKTASQKLVKSVKKEPVKVAAKKVRKAKQGAPVDSCEALVDSAIRQHISPLVRMLDKIAKCNGGQGREWKGCNAALNSVIQHFKQMKAGKR